MNIILDNETWRVLHCTDTGKLRVTAKDGHDTVTVLPRACNSVELRTLDVAAFEEKELISG